MVLRSRKIDLKSDEVQVHCSFSLVDVKALMRLFAALDSQEFFSKYQPTDQDIRSWLENDGRAFLSWPPKWREELSRWAIAVAVRNKLLIPTAANENRYYLADSLFVRRGRPPKDY